MEKFVVVGGKKLHGCARKHRIKKGKESMEVEHKGTLKPLNITTVPYSGFPTDTQPFLTVLLSTANGTSIITEIVFKQRFSK